MNDFQENIFTTIVKTFDDIIKNIFKTSFPLLGIYIYMYIHIFICIWLFFSSPTGHFHNFFLFQSLLKKKFLTWSSAIYLNFHYFGFFINYDKHSTLIHTVFEKKLCHLQDTVLQCIFPKTHISIYC